MVVEKYFRLPCQIGKVSHKFLRNFSGNSILCKQFLCEPTARQPFESAVGSVRNVRRLAAPTHRIKMPDLPLDKRFPFEYRLRIAKNPYTHPGDRARTLGFEDPTQPKLYFEDSEELKSANDDVKRLFSLGLANKKDVLAVKFAEMRKKVQRHPLDNTSLEVKIAMKTVRVRYFFEEYEKDLNCKMLKVCIMVLIQKRSAMLDRLRKIDDNRYRWILNVLDIDFERPLEGIRSLKPTRNREIERLTDEFCENVRSSKVKAYHEDLKSKQPAFLEEKEKTLKWIAEEEQQIKEKMDQMVKEEEEWWKLKESRS